MSKLTFNPDYVSHPGKTLEESLETIRRRTQDVAKDLGIEPERLEEILAGKAPITKDLAKKLEALNIGKASFWNTSQTNYVEGCKRQKRWDVLVIKDEDRKVDHVAGTALPEEHSFHTVGKRLDTVSERINERYSAVAVPAGLFGKGDVLPEDVEEYNG